MPTPEQLDRREIQPLRARRSLTLRQVAITGTESGLLNGETVDARSFELRKLSAFASPLGSYQNAVIGVNGRGFQL